MQTAAASKKMPHTYTKIRTQLMSEGKELPLEYKMTPLERLAFYYEHVDNDYTKKKPWDRARDYFARKGILRANGRPYIEYNGFFENPEDFMNDKDTENMLMLERLQDDGRGAETKGKWKFRHNTFDTCTQLYSFAVRNGIEDQKRSGELPPDKPDEYKDWHDFNKVRGNFVKSRMTRQESLEAAAKHRELLYSGKWDEMYDGMFATEESRKAAYAAGDKARKAAELRGDGLMFAHLFDSSGHRIADHAASASASAAVLSKVESEQPQSKSNKRRRSVDRSVDGDGVDGWTVLGTEEPSKSPRKSPRKSPSKGSSKGRSKGPRKGRSKSPRKNKGPAKEAAVIVISDSD